MLVYYSHEIFRKIIKISVMSRVINCLDFSSVHRFARFISQNHFDCIYDNIPLYVDQINISSRKLFDSCQLVPKLRLSWDIYSPINLEESDCVFCRVSKIISQIDFNSIKKFYDIQSSRTSGVSCKPTDFRNIGYIE